MESAAPPNWYLRYQGRPVTRVVFFWTGMGIFSTVGMAYYSFPLWLNQIVVDYVDLSPEELSFLGGMSYISLGLSGGFVLLSKKLELSPKSEFLYLTYTFSACAVLPWGLLYWLISTSPDAGGHNVVMVGFILLLQGFAAGAFYATWCKYILAIVQQSCETLVIAMANIVFPLFAVLLMYLKFDLGNVAWVRMVMFIQIVFFGWLVVFSTVFGQDCLVLPDNVPPSRQTSKANDDNPIHMRDVLETEEAVAKEPEDKPRTGQVLKDLLMGRRKRKAGALLASKHSTEVTSYQFYFILAAYVLFNCVGTAFMANIGPLTSHSDEDNKSKHEQLLVLISANAGQTVGRFLYPLIYRCIVYMYKPPQNELTTKDYNQRLFAGIVTRTCFGQTIMVSILFILSLVIVRADKTVQYIYAFTAISVGYGLMWVIVTNYPSFLSGHDFDIVSSFFLCAGSISTLAIVSIISWAKFNNDAIFTTLLIGSVATVAAAGVGMWDRIRNESFSD
jgi:hypothetical protein